MSAAAHQPSRSFTSASPMKKPYPFLNTATERVFGDQRCGFRCAAAAAGSWAHAADPRASISKMDMNRLQGRLARYIVDLGCKGQLDSQILTLGERRCCNCFVTKGLCRLASRVD